MNFDNEKFNGFFELHYPTCLQQVRKISHLLENKVVFDIGSNIGLFAKAIIDIVNYKHIHLFEPSEEYFEQSKNFLKNYNNITYNNFAVGNSNSKLTLYKDETNIGWNTLYAKDPLQKDGFFQNMIFEDVNVIRLDDYYKDIEQVDFIKIDVEGYEGEVLEGSWEIIKKFKPYLLIEVAWGTNHPEWEVNEKIYKRLFSLGYKNINFSNHTEDILFEPIL